MNKIAFFLIAFYQRVSIVFPPRCRFIPSCSEYSKQAFLQHNFHRAVKVSLWRILRCNPFSHGGVDPVK